METPAGGISLKRDSFAFEKTLRISLSCKLQQFQSNTENARAAEYILCIIIFNIIVINLTENYFNAPKFTIAEKGERHM